MVALRKVLFLFEHDVAQKPLVTGIDGKLVRSTGWMAVNKSIESKDASL
jgi:hypothetical protein